MSALRFLPVDYSDALLARSTLSDRHQHSGRKRAAAANVASGALHATDGKPHEHPSAAAALGAPHGRAESRPGHGPGRRCTHFPDMRFPAPSSSSQSSTVPAASHRSDREVLSLTEDHTGAMWVGTSHGLYSLSGATVTSYLELDGLPHNRINALLED